MIVTRYQLKKIIIEALSGLHYGSKRQGGGYEFSDKPPKNMSAAGYSDRLTKGVSDAKVVKNLFKKSILPINLIIVPDLIYSDLFGSAMTSLFWLKPRLASNTHSPIPVEKFGNMLTSSYVVNMFRGKSKELADIKSSLDSGSLNIIVQGSTYETTSSNYFDMSWLAHDTLGHYMNFGLETPWLESVEKIKHNLAARFGGVGSVERAVKGGAEDKLGLGYVDKKTYEYEAGSGELLGAVRKDLEKINFAPAANDEDVATSLIAYFVLNGKWTDSVYDGVASGIVDQKFLNSYESLIKNVFNDLIGDVLISTVDAVGG